MIAYAKTTPGYSQYRQQSAMTASPGELTLMLYDGCIKFLKQSKLYMSEKNREKASIASIKAQKIVTELMSSLNMHYQVSEQLFYLYEFIQRTMVDANMQMSEEKTDIALDLITDLRDTWQQAVRLNRAQVMGQGFLEE